MFTKCGLFVCCVVAVVLSGEGEARQIPSYIQVCKRNDPHIEDCILNSVERLRPKLIRGIPDLEVPALEPLRIPEVVIPLSEQGARAVGHNVIVLGASQFKITKLKVDMSSLTFSVGIAVPQLRISSNYEANLRVGTLPIVAKGPLRANTTGLTAEAILYAKLQTRNGVQYMSFPKVEIDVLIDNLHVRIDNLFPNKALTDSTNLLINENSREIVKSIQPIIEKTVGNLIIDIANKIVKDIPFDQIFVRE